MLRFHFAARRTTERAHTRAMDSTASEMGMMGALRTGNMVFDMIIAMTVPYIFKLLMDLANGQARFATTAPLATPRATCHATRHAPCATRHELCAMRHALRAMLEPHRCRALTTCARCSSSGHRTTRRLQPSPSPSSNPSRSPGPGPSPSPNPKQVPHARHRAQDPADELGRHDQPGQGKA